MLVDRNPAACLPHGILQIAWNPGGVTVAWPHLPPHPESHWQGRERGSKQPEQVPKTKCPRQRWAWPGGPWSQGVWTPAGKVIAGSGTGRKQPQLESAGKSLGRTVVRAKDQCEAGRSCPRPLSKWGGVHPQMGLGETLRVSATKLPCGATNI